MYLGKSWVNLKPDSCSSRHAEGPAGGDRLQFLRGNYSPHKGAVLQGKLQALPVHFPTLPYFTKQPCLIKMLRDAAGSGLRHPGSLPLW